MEEKEKDKATGVGEGEQSRKEDGGDSMVKGRGMEEATERDEEAASKQEGVIVRSNPSSLSGETLPLS